MGVIVKVECQQCEDIREDEFDGVLILGYKRNEDGSAIFPYWSHHMGAREAMISILNLLKDGVEEFANDSGMSPFDALISVIQHGNFGLKD